ncbi:uncharacterized protein LOC125714456 [Brienomyrus brachyistius]|uniref:uncharacterized protein LOC125714456 n=1 Tax=Brienomyrus brachyistius TaxID=42636 RepID=UPI0020B2093D|nr:uncharacterized protein LOC125714456 [Brienomyrus brachyistius]
MPADKMQWMEFITVGLLLCTGGPAAGAGGESLALYVTEGDDITLPCKNVHYPDCSSTTWLYAERSNIPAVELVAHGKIKESQKHRRLNVPANCSLHINNVSAEHAGSYTCQQFINGQKYGNDTAVFLSVLTVRKSQSGGTVTLQCLLYTSHDGQCPPFHTVTLRWVSDTDPPGQIDPSSQTHTNPCISTLSIDHRRTEKDQRKWRCQLLDTGKVKLTSSPEQGRGKTTGNKHRPTVKTPTAISVTVCLSPTKTQLTDSPEDNNDYKGTTLKTPTHTGSHTNHTNHTTVDVPITGAGFLPGIGAAAAVCLAAVVMVTYRRRADGSSPPRMSENDMASNPNTTEDEVTYSMVNHLGPKKRERANPDDFTEYATVRIGA